MRPRSVRRGRPLAGSGGPSGRPLAFAAVGQIGEPLAHLERIAHHRPRLRRLPASFAGLGVEALAEGSGVAVVDDAEAPAGADDTCWIRVGV